MVAGIIGRKKYAYDCTPPPPPLLFCEKFEYSKPITNLVVGWSDTTNTASRMESNGNNGCVQVTPETFDLLLRNKENFEKRGTFI